MCAGFFIDTFHYFFIGVRFEMCVLCSVRVLHSMFSFSLFCAFVCYGQPFGLAKRLVCSYLLVCFIVFIMHIGCCCRFFLSLSRKWYEYENVLVLFWMLLSALTSSKMLVALLCYVLLLVHMPIWTGSRGEEWERERDVCWTFIYFSIACANDLQVFTAFSPCHSHSLCV